MFSNIDMLEENSHIVEAQNDFSEAKYKRVCRDQHLLSSPLLVSANLNNKRD